MEKFELYFWFYYDCFMCFNVCLVLLVLKCVSDKEFGMIVMGYGFLLWYNVVDLMLKYENWSKDV